MTEEGRPTDESCCPIPAIKVSLGDIRITIPEAK